jgi:hypothetical protein
LASKLRANWELREQGKEAKLFATSLLILEDKLNDKLNEE